VRVRSIPGGHGSARDDIDALEIDSRRPATASRAPRAHLCPHFIESRQSRIASGRQKSVRIDLLVERVLPGSVREHPEATRGILSALATIPRPDDTIFLRARRPSRSRAMIPSAFAAILSAIAIIFWGHAISGMPDASSYRTADTRRTRVGHLIIHHYHQCRDARPSSGQCRGAMYERRLTQKNRDGGART
jgi:hypothetical protein